MTATSLSAFILDRLDDILSEWDAFARTMTPPALTMDDKALRDHAAEMLHVIAADLAQPQTADEQSRKSRGLGLRSKAESAAESHAEQRLAAGFSIVQLVGEYRALRASVLKLWAESARSGQLTDVVDITRFNEAIDQALAESVERFAEMTAHQAAQEQGRLQALLDAAPVGIGMTDKSGRLTVVNQANRDIWGDLPLSESVDRYVEYRGWWADGSERHGKPLAPHEWGLARALLKGETAHDLIEIEPFDAPGTRKTILLYAQPVRGTDQIVKGAVVAQMDITGQVKAEQALRESEARFRTITDAMPQMVWSTRPDGFHDYFNQRWYDFTGLTPGETDGAGWSEVFHPDDRERAWELWRHSLATGEPYEIEYRLRHHSGEYRWVLGRALAVRDDQNRIVRWMGTCTDIDSQKQIEKELAAVHAESERRRRLYETFLENSPDLGYVFDLDHRFTYANKVLLQMWGKSWDEAIGKNCLELGYESWHAEMHSREIEQVKATRQPVKGEVPFDGTFGRRVYEYIFVPVIGPDGTVEAIAGTTRDVTERKAAEDSLRESNRRKDEFLAMLAHELRNPLAPITAAAEALALLRLDQAGMRRATEILLRQVRHMTGLIDDLLDISRVTRGLINLEMGKYDLRALVSNSVEQVRPLLDKHGHELQLALCGVPAYVNGDQKRLIQIITNLLNNAAKYTPPGGKIEVSVQPTHDRIEFAVIDNGIGIDSELLPHIFDLFTQGERSSDRTQGGLGIGLALVKQLVELHQGAVTSHSEGPGRGSKFAVSLPRTTPPMQHPSAAADAGGDRITRQILVVDDNMDSANMLALNLGLSGHEVEVEFTAQGALDAARVRPAQVYVLDIGLPDMDGYALACQLRLMHPTVDAIFIAVTGYGQQRDRERSRGAGFDHHFVKPVQADQLLLAIAGKPA